MLGSPMPEEIQEVKTGFEIKFGKPIVFVDIGRDSDEGRFVDRFRVRVPATITIMGVTIEDWDERYVGVNITGESEEELIKKIVTEIERAKKALIEYWSNVYKIIGKISEFADVQIVMLYP